MASHSTTTIELRAGQRVRITNHPTSIWAGYAGREGQYLRPDCADDTWATVLLDNATGLPGLAGTRVSLRPADLETVQA